MKVLYVVIFSLVIIAIITIVRAERKQGSSFSKILVSIAPLATLATISYQIYVAYRAYVSDQAEIDMSLVNASWIDVLDYVERHKDKLKCAYIKIHPEEAPMLVSDGYDLNCNDPITFEEIQLAHRVAQACENYLTSHGCDEVLDVTWRNVFYSWWRSSRMQSIWPMIKSKYTPETQRLIDRYIAESRTETRTY